MYQVYYIINNVRKVYDFDFNTIIGATYKARKIFEEHGFTAEVMDKNTGELHAIFSPAEIYLSEEYYTEYKRFLKDSLAQME
jgi:hypothetical protein